MAHRDTRAVRIGPHDLSMNTSRAVEFQLEPPSLGHAVSVRLRDFKDRWFAVAECRAVRHSGLGSTAREALVAALAPLGPKATAALMAEPAMFGASLKVLAR
jgi:hypothetical protein